MKLILILFLIFVNYIFAEKLESDILKNYSEFFNFGNKKLSSKLERQKYENTIFKSKVDILGAVFKKNIDFLKIHGILDLIFLIDASSSVGEYNFKSELKFVKKLLSDVTVDFNHTRVAVITFSSQDNIIDNINEITKPKDANNKCLLLNNEITQIKYSGGGTYTLGAFKMAQEIFQKSRNESKKVLFLITDGYSNGGDPIPIANELKSNGTTIFTIGILNGNYKELYEISTEPGELYSYLLDSFEEFESLARRALHVDLQSGDYIPLFSSEPCDKLCENGNCCDENAFCTCGTSTGHYNCLCKPGYYGSGLNGSCSLCPSDSYSSGPNLCLPCPDIHHYTTPPASGIDSCTCKAGYRATDNNACEVIRCPKLSAPENGYFVKRKDCSNVLNSACGVRCNVGYTLIGSSIRLCQENATWSGHTPSCQVKTCSKLQPPAHGNMKCIHSDLGEDYTDELLLPVDTVCNFSCERGRTLVGSSHRTCLPLAQWDGLRTACKLIKCNKLSKINFGKVEPISCIIGKQPFGKECNFTCGEGFELVGPEQKVCTGQHGTWDTQEEVFCKDIEKPKIVCPNNVKGQSVPGKPYGLVHWDSPNATDNSNLNISIWTKPAIKDIATFKFKIGETTVTYFAQDASNNKEKCNFTVEIEDIEPPTIETCVDPPPFLLTDKKMNITWDEPNIFDNSGNVNITKTHEFGIFDFGMTQIVYTALDSSNNSNSCILNITVQESKCEVLQDPNFGHSDCKPFSDRIHCVVTCEEGYALPIHNQGIVDLDVDNGTEFICKHSDLLWKNQDSAIYPECTVTEIPLEINHTGVITIQPDSDICEDTKKSYDFENNINQVLHENLKENCEGFDCKIQTNLTCPEKITEEDEEVTNVITKREVGRANRKRKRRRKKINLAFNLQMNKRRNTRKKFPRIENSLQNFSKNKNYSLELNIPKIKCPLGAFSRNLKCITCPEGTFHNTTSNSCQSCQIGSYNDKIGQTECLVCPKNYSTRKLHAKTLKDCKEQCPPGTYARKKQIKHPKNHPNSIIERITLKPYCRSCPIGHYQTDYGQTHCTPCPDGFTTLERGCVNASQCIKPCEGLCNHGSCFIENGFFYYCICDEGYIGTRCEIKLGLCRSNPCQNNGTCIEEEGNYRCNCTDGYAGRNCAEVIEKCSLTCQNEGICLISEEDEQFCLCREGFGGQFCEIPLKYCRENICENGGTCNENNFGFNCTCIKGFVGKRCSYLPCDYRLCPTNSICVNLDEDYRCDCSPGYAGENCSKIIDACSKNPCENKGRCVQSKDEFKCICPKGYTGEYCEITKKQNYVLNFPRSSTTDFIALDGFKDDLTEISICAWMHVSDNFNYGTLVSYATDKYDNAFTVTDYTGLVLYVNNKYIVTDILLNDGSWHHFCAVWFSTNGVYKLYLDGKLSQQGNNLSAGGGKLVVGQEQDMLGGKFSQAEAYLGKIAYLDIYSFELNDSYINKIMNSCDSENFGDLYAWPEFADYTRGGIQIEASTFCENCPNPGKIHNGKINIINNTAFYSCNDGFKLSNLAYINGRKCLKSSLWEGNEEPYCKIVHCGHPGAINKGTIIGKNFDYLDEIVYKCNYGYNLTGPSRRVCDKDGLWKPAEPTCIGIQCKKFPIPENSITTVTTEDDVKIPFDDYFPNVDIGIEVEVICKEPAILEGVSTIICQSNGLWDYEPPVCSLPKPKPTPLPCAMEHIPSPPQNGFIVKESLERVKNNTSDTVEYKCENGFRAKGYTTSTCILDGYWSELGMTCTIMACEEKPKYPNMILKIPTIYDSPVSIGQIATFQCLIGYKAYGNLKVRCILPGLWSRMQGKCIRISCGKPAVNEETVIIGNSYLYNDTIMLKCGTEIKNLKCGFNGLWLGDRKNC